MPTCSVSEQFERRQKVFALLRKFGSEANSFQTLLGPYAYWFDGDDACVPYVDTGAAWLAAGSPIATSARIGEVALAFMGAARRAGRRAVLFGTECDYSAVPAAQSMLIGMQPLLRPAIWLSQLASNRAMRCQVRAAFAHGVRITRTSPGSRELQTEMELLNQRWLASKPLAPMGFLAEVDLFAFADQRRYFTARVGDALLGFAIVSPIYSRRGWLIHHLVRAPDAPTGTVEALIECAVFELARSDTEYVSLGLTALSGRVAPWLKLAKNLGAPLYNFDGLERFRTKLQPQYWSPIYLTCPRRQSMALALLDSLVGFAHGRPIEYALRTWHHRRVVPPFTCLRHSCLDVGLRSLG